MRVAAISSLSVEITWDFSFLRIHTSIITVLRTSERSTPPQVHYPSGVSDHVLESHPRNIFLSTFKLPLSVPSNVP